jgi:NADPH-dependent 2,4-dienoyl-CoA reductase/sulfur reductase-like enzyme
LYTADELAARGLRVSLITPHNAIAETLTVTLRVPLYKRLLGAGARFHVNCEVVAVQGRAVTLRNVYTQGTEIIEDVDLLVPWHGNRSVDALSEALLDDRRKVHVIGDSLAPREMDIAVAEGAMIAREI